MVNYEPSVPWFLYLYRTRDVYTVCQRCMAWSWPQCDGWGSKPQLHEGHQSLHVPSVSLAVSGEPSACGREESSHQNLFIKTQQFIRVRYMFIFCTVRGILHVLFWAVDSVSMYWFGKFCSFFCVHGKSLALHISQYRVILYNVLESQIEQW